MNFKDWSSVLGTWVSIGGAVLGGFLALQAYNRDIDVRKQEADKRADARVVQTFALFEQFQSPEMLRVRSKLTAVTNTGDISTLQGQHDLFAYVDYFDAVQICIDRDICERELADQLLGPYAKGGFPYLQALVAETRGAECEAKIASQRPYAYGLETLATGKAPSSDCANYPVQPPHPSQQKSPDLSAGALVNR